MAKDTFESHLTVADAHGGGGGSSVALESTTDAGTNAFPPFYHRNGGLPPYVKEGDIEYPFEDTTGIGDENKIRGNWSSHVDFVLASLGYVVSLGNLWRFPHYCYVNGGAAFLVPYCTMLLLTGIPVFLMEISLGQFASLGCITVWKVCPLFKGVGVSMFLVSCYIAVYYNVFTSWSIFYLVSSVRPSLPWASCGVDWSSRHCTSWTRTLLETCNRENGTLLRNGTCLFELDEITPDGPPAFFMQKNRSSVFADAASLLVADPTEINRTFPSHEFFDEVVLKRSSGIDQLGSIHWQLALYLLIAWLLVFFCTFKSVKTSGKVVYVTAIAPYIILLVLLVRLLTLGGSFEGLKFFFNPKWHKLLEPKVWGDAAAQVFYSLASCWGGLITLASYNRFHHNCLKSVCMVAVGDVLSSVFAATVAFATVGYVSYERMALLNETADSLLAGGPTTAFVGYAEAIARLPAVAPIWSMLFFAILIMVALNTQLVVVETVVTAICDEFPERLRRNHRHVLMFVCVGCYCGGVALLTGAGAYMINLAEAFLTTWSLLIIGFFEVMVVSWIYGVDNLLDNIKWMVRFYPPPYILWRFVWKLFTPIALLAILTYSWVGYKPLWYYNVYEYPPLAITVGWLLSFSSVLAIPLTAFWAICRGKGSLMQRIQHLLSPSEDWGPALAVHRSEQYPLQIPEARYPIAPPMAFEPPDVTRHSPPLLPSSPIGRLSASATPVRQPPLGSERDFGVPLLDAEPQFDRETAI